MGFMLQSSGMPDVSRAVEQIEAIHDQLARASVYRGWRSIPVAASGVIGLAAAAWQSAAWRPVEPVTFAAYWIAVAFVALVVGCSEIAWRYVAREDADERRQSRRVFAQFVPALVAGALVGGALVRLSPALVTLLPGLWALFFGVAIFAAAPHVPSAARWVALYYWTAGIALLWTATGVDQLSPWAVGGTFGVGQIVGAVVLYWTLERRTDVGSEEDGVEREEA
jgi:hypothetical protein